VPHSAGSAPVELELFQFPYSHYNEKVRWALDWKGVPHRRVSLLPGPHAPRVWLLSRDTRTPVRLRERDAAGDVRTTVVAGSARILADLERRHPEPPLLPASARDRARALEIERWLDADVGPLVRRALFARLLDAPGYLCDLFAATRSPAQRALYRAGFPLLRRVMARSMGIAGPASLAEAEAGTRRGLDFVAEHAAADGALVGGRDGPFGAAELVAASLLAPAAAPPGSPVELPQPPPPAVAEWLAGWADHPGAAWVRDQYARHHGPAASPAEDGQGKNDRT